MAAPENRSFVAEGAVKNTAHLAMKQPFEESRLRGIMRSQGFVPNLDKTPTLETNYLKEKDTFKYTITVHGVKVDRPWEYEGVLSGRLIPATPGTKWQQLRKQLV